MIRALGKNFNIYLPDQTSDDPVNQILRNERRDLSSDVRPFHDLRLANLFLANQPRYFPNICFYETDNFFL